jgi:4-amino-4-deoxy-L-arabinose transferase-like glycosyltransferase
MMRSQRVGRRYLAGLVMVFAIVFFTVGTLGPAHRSPYYLAIVPLPAAIALFLGWRAWTEDEKSTAYSAAAIVLLIAVLGLSHLLPRSHS